MITLLDIEKQVEKFSAIINVPKNLLPTYGYSIDFGYPHIEVDNAGRLHFVINERGQELERQTTNELDELLYWIFDSITFSMACKFELNNRLPAQDCRRIIFSKQEELLSQLNSDWQLREHKKHKKILEDHPFNDTVST